MEELTINSEKNFVQLSEIETNLRKMKHIPNKYNNFIYKTDLELNWPEIDNCIVFGNPKTNFYFYLTNEIDNIIKYNDYFVVDKDNRYYLRYNGNNILKITINLPDELCYFKKKGKVYQIYRSNKDKEFINSELREGSLENYNYTKPEVFRIFWEKEVNFDISEYINLIHDLTFIENNIEFIKKIDYSKCYGYIGDKISELYSLYNLKEYKPIPYIDYDVES